jgi:DNA-binding transcriptional LysR family regulator
MATTNGSTRSDDQGSRLDLNRVAMFVRIAEAKGVSAAATRAKLPKSSVSRALTQLEDELGLELVVRRSKSFQLTQAGQQLYEAAAKGLAVVEEARDELRPDASTPRGRLRIAAPPSFATFVVSPTIVAFTRRFPEVEAELCVTAANLDPRRDGFDIVVSVGPLEDASAMVRRLATVDGGIFASNAYLAERGLPRRPADLTKHDCILMARAPSKTSWAMRGPGGMTEVTVHGRITVDDHASAIAVAMAGGGLVVLPLGATAKNPVLERVLPDYVVPGETAQIVYAASRHIPPRISMFCDALVAAAKAGCREHTSTP